MQETLIKIEPWVRLSFFIFFFLSFCWVEQRYPWRKVISSLTERWAFHLSWVMISNFFVRLLFPVALVKLAIEVEYAHQLSLFQLPELEALPIWTHYVFGFLFLDLLMYWQHRIFHRIKLLWRLHLMHHTDKVLDASTGIRFHPLEYIFSMGIKMMGVILIGPPAVVVLIFEIVLNAASMFTHANIQFKPEIERILRYVIVTPEMHRVHHSDIEDERDKNFGFFLSCWDRILGTYLPFSRMSDRKLVIGVEEFRNAEYQTIRGMLFQPFYKTKKKKTRKAISKLMRMPDSEHSP